MTWDEFVSWAGDYAGVFGIVAIVISVLLAIWAVSRTRLDNDTNAFRDEIRDPASWNHLIERLGGSSSEAYFAAVGWLLRKADDFYGPPLRWKAFDRSLLLAFFYPVIGASAGWIFFNQHSPGGHFMFFDYPNSKVRWFWAASSIAVILIGCFAILSSGQVWKYFRRKTFGTNSESAIARYLDPFFGPLIISILGAMLIVMVAGMGAGAFPIAFLSTIFVFIVLSGSSNNGMVSLVAAISFFVFDWLFFDVAATGRLFLFLFITIPIANALADFLSLAITRTLLRRMADHEARPTLGQIFWKSIIDLALAIYCLFGLLFGLRFILDTWAGISPDTLPFDWRAYWEGVQADWTTGVALYFMVFTTLIPTLVHASVGLAAVFTHKARLSRRVVRRLEDWRATNHEPSNAEVNELVGTMRQATMHGRRIGWGISLAGFFAVGGAAIWAMHAV